LLDDIDNLPSESKVSQRVGTREDCLMVVVGLLALVVRSRNPSAIVAVSASI